MRPFPSALILILLASATLWATDRASAEEYEIKAAMLLNLPKFVEWPASRLGEANAPFVIGVLGQEPFGEELDRQTAGRTILGHRVVVQRVSGGVRPESCQMMFISRGERHKLDEWMALLAHSSVLTVGDGEHFAEGGTVFGLVLRGDRVQLEVNLAAAQRSGLVVSSRILKLATVVKDGT